MWVDLSSNFCHLSDIIRPPLRTNSLYEKPTVIFSPHTPAGHVRLARFTLEDHAYGASRLPVSTDYSVWRCQLAAACWGGSRVHGCHGYLPFGLWLLLPAKLLSTSFQAHLFVMSLMGKKITDPPGPKVPVCLCIQMNALVVLIETTLKPRNLLISSWMEWNGMNDWKLYLCVCIY